jgi:protein gp37
MAQKTSIEWCDVSWNPVRGCSRVSEGCRNCYAERMAARFSGFGQPFTDFAAMTPAGPLWTGKVALIPEKLDEPLHWRKPRRVFVNSMSDLFHEGLSDRDVAKVFSAMRFAPRHTFQVLTKRPARMLEWFSKCGNGGGLGWITHNNTEPERAYRGTGVIVGESDRWPLPNVWLGVSVENQATADERIPLLLQTPAAVRFVSLEPLLGPVDISQYLDGRCGSCGAVLPRSGSAVGECSKCEWGTFYAGIQWAIIGGESGPGARPMDLAWLESAVQQCREAGVPIFIKQDSGRFPGQQGRIPDDLWIKEFPHDPRS